MSKFNPRTQLAAIAVTLAALLAPAAAFAKGKNRPSFPMTAAAFNTHVEKRLQRMEARMDKRLQKRNPPAEKQQAIKARFAKVAQKVRAAAAEAGADGTVTKEEAKKVRQLVRKMRKRHTKGRKHRRGSSH